MYLPNQQSLRDEEYMIFDAVYYLPFRIYFVSRPLPLTEVTDGVVGLAFPTRNDSIALDVVRSRQRVLEVGKFGCCAASIPLPFLFYSGYKPWEFSCEPLQ